MTQDTAKELSARLRDACIDWTGAQMLDGEEPRSTPNCDELRKAADFIDSQAARIAELEAEVQAIIDEGIDEANEERQFMSLISQRVRSLLTELLTLRHSSAEAYRRGIEDAAKVAEGCAAGFAYVDNEPTRQGAAQQVARAIRTLAPSGGGNE